MYAWSIGGFDATVAGSAYRELKGLYLDATFDDVMPLADNVMPKALAPITVKTIRYSVSSRDSFNNRIN